MIKHTTITRVLTNLSIAKKKKESYVINGGANP